MCALASPTARSLCAAFLANVIFGFSFLFTKVSLQFTTPFVLLASRFFVAFVLLTLVLVLTRRRFVMRGKPWGLLLLLGIFHPLLYFVGETYGVLYTSSTFSAIMIALIPIVSIWASAIFLKEAATPLQCLFCAISVVGVLLITVHTSGGSNQWKGVLLLLLAVFANVGFNLLSRKISLTFRPLSVLTACS